jgi:lipopolysaccharide transport system ATP-binding protein
MRSEIAISVKNLAKTYRIFGHPGDRIKQALTFGRMRFHRQFTVLQGISFDINKGEAVAIVGRNGSGKSTLLQLVCGILKPTSGYVKVSGRVCALLELGSGFNPEFTGRENVYFQGAIIGVPKEEMDARLESILAFADIGEFIDQPVRTYSSGMFVRLAFAVIANVDADILVIDEALAVGDVFFQQKCMRHLRDFQNKGGTILFVSHDAAAVVALCQKAILLTCNAECNMTIGSAKEICQIYIRQFYKERSQINGLDFRMASADESAAEPTNLETRPGEESVPSRCLSGENTPGNILQLTRFRAGAENFGCGSVVIVDAWFEDKTRAKLLTVRGGDAVSFCIKATSLAKIKLPAFGFTIKNHLGQYLFSEDTDQAFRRHALTTQNGDTWVVSFSFLMPLLIQGDYSINVAVAEGTGDDHIQHHWIEDVITLHSINSRLTQGICGLQDLSIEIAIFRGRAEHAVEL